MSLIERQIRVTFRHQVHFTRGVFHPSNSLLSRVLVNDETRRKHRALVVLDENLVRALPGLPDQIEKWFGAFGELRLVAPPLMLPGGERVKNAPAQVQEVQACIDRYHLDRHSYVIAVGGGALLDMVGLAAATAHRGMRHVRLPSTTLSQADSGVGVKNGINAFGKKNFVGTFSPPFAVINDFELLASLSPRDQRAGFIEAVKVALIRDAAFFEALEDDADRLRHFEKAAMERLIYRCAELHLEHIATSGDPFEFGSARPLDFGHWAAHKLEQLSDFQIRHGEAVAIGIALDVIYSQRVRMIDGATAERILGLIEKLGFRLFTSDLLRADATGSPLVLGGLEEFREHLGGQLTITLLEGIGRGVEVDSMDSAVVTEAIDDLRKRAKRRGLAPVECAPAIRSS